MLVATSAFGRTHIGRDVLVRYNTVPGGLSVALGVSFKGRARKAMVQGTIVRLVRQRATINAGGSLLDVRLRQSNVRRALAGTQSGPKVGDTVKVEVEIDGDGTLADAAVISTKSAGGARGGSKGEMDVRGTVSAIAPATVDAGGSITVVVRGLPVTCVIPAGVALDLAVGDLVELECRLVGDPAAWTVRGAETEDDSEDDEESRSSGSHGGSAEVEVRGAISAAFTQTSEVVVVTPDDGGPDVSCAIVSRLARTALPPATLSSWSASPSTVR